MHSSSCDLEQPRLDGAEVFVALAALVTEGRTPPKLATKTRGFSEGPHCTLSKASLGHVCNFENALCIKYDNIRSYVLSLWQKSLPLCVDVLLVPKCCCENDLICNPSTSLEPIGSAFLLEQWHLNILHRTHDFSTNFNVNQLINAIRSQLYFSQLSAWLASPDEQVRLSFLDKSVVYCLTVPGETFGCAKFASNAQHHNFPTADLGNGVVLNVSLSNLPRTDGIPPIKCSKCDMPMPAVESHISVLDDRMQISCTLKGKHRCDDYDDFESCCHRARYKKHPDTMTANTTITTTTTSTSGCKPLFTGKLSDDNNTPSTSQCLLASLSNLMPNADVSNDTNTTQGASKARLQLNFNFNAETDSKCDINKCNDTGKVKGYEKASQLGASKLDLELSKKEFVEVLNVLRQSGPIKQPNTKKHDLGKQSKGDILLDAILRSSKVQSAIEKDPMENPAANISPGCERNKRKCVHKMTGAGGARSGECAKYEMRESDNTCDMNDTISDTNISIGASNIYVDVNCDNVKRKKTDYIKLSDISNVFSLEYMEKRQKVKVKQKITFEEEPSTRQPPFGRITSSNSSEAGRQGKDVHSVVGAIPSALEQAKFRKSLDSAASMVFHSRTGLPLTSSPAPVRRGRSCFDFDSSINSVSAIRSALFSLASCSTDEDSESDCSIVSPCSPDATNGLKQRDIPPVKYRHRGQSSGLLDFRGVATMLLSSSLLPTSCLFLQGTSSGLLLQQSFHSNLNKIEDPVSNRFEDVPCAKRRNFDEKKEAKKQRSFVESVLNGRLEPVSTVHGFTAELGASGSFCPRHVLLPVTVFFYTLGDNDKVSTPYLGHINLGKKGYNVPKSGTIQVTLFNPLGTVVKMFVIMYDLSDMPPNSQTFIRQRTLFMPANCHDHDLEWSQKWLRYLIHLRFMSSKSGRIYLHSDIRMIICRKSDLDTATAHGIDMSYELRSFTNCPSNPRFSPRI